LGCCCLSSLKTMDNASSLRRLIAVYLAPPLVTPAAASAVSVLSSFLPLPAICVRACVCALSPPPHSTPPRCLALIPPLSWILRVPSCALWLSRLRCADARAVYQHNLPAAWLLPLARALPPRCHYGYACLCLHCSRLTSLSVASRCALLSCRERRGCCARRSAFYYPLLHLSCGSAISHSGQNTSGGLYRQTSRAPSRALSNNAYRLPSTALALPLPLPRRRRSALSRGARSQQHIHWMPPCCVT